MLEEAGVGYELETVDIRDAGREDSPEFRTASPLGKVPALVDGEVRVAESAAICLYLADRYASGRLAPDIDDPARGEFLFWTMYSPAVIEPAMAEKFSGAASNRLSHGWGDFDTMIGALEQGLAGRRWILGDTFSAADVMLGSSVIFMRGFKVLPDSPELLAYADRCLEREAYRKAMARDSG